jgi:hypothetical protein
MGPSLAERPRQVPFAAMSDADPDRKLVDPHRVRMLPAHFAWVDHRLRGVLHTLSLEEIALLFFLHLAADKTGCSFWADGTIGRKIGLPEGEVVQARQRLLSKRLIAYRYPLYQILPVSEGPKR